MALAKPYALLILGLATGGCFDLDFGWDGGLNPADGIGSDPDGPARPFVECDECEGPRAVGDSITLEASFHATCVGGIAGPFPCDYDDYTLDVWCDEEIGVACEVGGPEDGELGTIIDVRPLEAGEVRIWVLMNIDDYVQIPPFTILAADRIDPHCYAGTPATPCAGAAVDAPVLLDLPLMAGEQRLLTEPVVTATQELEWTLVDGPSLDPDRYAAGETAHVVRLRNLEGPVSVTAEHEGIAVSVDLWVRGAARGQGPSARP